MQNINVHRYEPPVLAEDGIGWAGYVEPEDKTWILFIGEGRDPLLWPNRDPETGAVIGEPATVKETAP